MTKRSLLTAALCLLSSVALAHPAPASKPAAAPAAAKAADADADSCGHDEAPDHDAAATPAPKDGAVLTRGEKVPEKTTVALKELLAAPGKHDGKAVVVEGTVRRACERKGCWMELADGKGPGVRVTFKDYGFFVPTDSAGRTARVAGLVKVANLSDAQADHYRSEGATVPVGTDGKAREVQLVATGVELRKSAAH